MSINSVRNRGDSASEGLDVLTARFMEFKRVPVCKSATESRLFVRGSRALGQPGNNLSVQVELDSATKNWARLMQCREK